MALSTRLAKGFTLMELLVTLAILAVLGFLLVSCNLVHVTLTSSIIKGQLMACFNNTRQIHIASKAMAEDGKTQEDPSLGWPGDLKARGRIATLADFVNVLVRNDYLRPGDLKVFSAAGIKAYNNHTQNSSDPNMVLDPPFTAEYNAFKVYLVKRDDPADTLFLASKNYTYDTPLNDPNAKPFGDKGFVVLRKDGSGRVLKKSQAQSLELIGKLPGGATVESAENCLNPGH